MADWYVVSQDEAQAHLEGTPSPAIDSIVAVAHGMSTYCAANLTAEMVARLWIVQKAELMPEVALYDDGQRQIILTTKNNTAPGETDRLHILSCGVSTLDGVDDAALLMMQRVINRMALVGAVSCWTTVAKGAGGLMAGWAASVVNACTELGLRVSSTDSPQGTFTVYEARL
jgi:hypothetical protein